MVIPGGQCLWADELLFFGEDIGHRCEVGGTNQIIEDNVYGLNFFSLMKMFAIDVKLVETNQF